VNRPAGRTSGSEQKAGLRIEDVSGNDGSAHMTS
jgi:hypothetical protein